MHDSRRVEAPDLIRSPDKYMQRAGLHKVLGRGRPSRVPCLSPRARVLKVQRAGADVGRYATLALVALLWSISTHVFSAGATSQEVVVSNLKSQLLEMGRKDQEVRQRLGVLLRQSPTLLRSPSPDLTALTTEMSHIDADNLHALEQIIARYGWPRSQDVGVEASGAAWVVLQHSPPEYQEKYFPLLKAAVTTGSIRADQVAMLEDRILVSQKKKPKYGTQVVSNANGEPEVYPVENPDELATLRESVGMPPMAEYLRRGEQDIGRPIGRGNVLPKDAEAPAK